MHIDHASHSILIAHCTQLPLFRSFARRRTARPSPSGKPKSHGSVRGRRSVADKLIEQLVAGRSVAQSGGQCRHRRIGNQRPSPWPRKSVVRPSCCAAADQRHQTGRHIKRGRHRPQISVQNVSAGKFVHPSLAIFFCRLSVQRVDKSSEFGCEVCVLGCTVEKSNTPSTKCYISIGNSTFPFIQMIFKLIQ